MAAFGRSSGHSKARKRADSRPATPDLAVKCVPRKARGAIGREVCDASVESAPAGQIMEGGIEIRAGESEIGLGDVESQLKELEVSSMTSAGSFGESTAGSEMASGAVEYRNPGNASAIVKIGSSSSSSSIKIWKKNAIFLLILLLTSASSLFLGIHIKMKLDEHESGPLPT